MFEINQHDFSSTTSLYASNQIFTRLQNLDILTFSKCQDFLTKVQDLIQSYDRINLVKMTAQVKINTPHSTVWKDNMITSSWVNFQEIHTTSNPGQPLVINYQDFLGYVLKMSLAHDKTNLLTNHQVNSTHTNASNDNYSSIYIAHIAAHFVNLSFSAGSIQEYQVCVATFCHHCCQRHTPPPNSAAWILEHY